MTDHSRLLSEMELPDEVIKKAIEAYWDTPAGNNPFRDDGLRPAIRAALQAMVDGGMAKIGTEVDYNWKDGSNRLRRQRVETALIIRLTADERKREEQT